VGSERTSNIKEDIVVPGTISHAVRAGVGTLFVETHGLNEYAMDQKIRTTKLRVSHMIRAVHGRHFAAICGSFSISFIFGVAFVQ
jgi:hypothetical protein